MIFQNKKLSVPAKLLRHSISPQMQYDWIDFGNGMRFMDHNLVTSSATLRHQIRILK
jgi:hypothetical protein